MRAMMIHGPDFDGVRLNEVPVPVPGPHEVRIRMRAATLNYRDLTRVWLFKPGAAPFVLLSCGCGEVEAVGDAVTRFKVGDRVAPTFFPDWLGGPQDNALLKRNLGNTVPGTASEYMVVGEQAAVHAPATLGDLEVATLPCAALTAWRSLFCVRATRPGDVVLLLGTGGVSIAALQLAKAAGAVTIITSSSDAKLARARALGADLTINYRTTPQWAQRVRELTGGAGADVVLDVAGGETTAQAAEALRSGGTMANIGLVAGERGKSSGRQDIDHPFIRVGSRADFENMNRAIVANRIRPVIDEVFELEELGRAMKVLSEGRVFGKIGIRIR
ncbi:NAD(P)-dependent alcohol dehydrogenase [Ramlibacter henchirensis]|uniref:NAD(P)-dependent alcohol dehydrogenase n=1 Tax=Ramlibacter henchirensis TaxID=204072 RepID=A0A4Z0BY83_9BURK|nr:NAD(P)-dependent alcohol dehydrogenase [Ramlibacter henchirensis]TFZ02879.1 NAD(P)-dependent alcohol dehydrogenase [Ramlibacter henchirensis]